MSEAERKAVHVLEDSPALEDAYGSHKRIADAIVNVVTTEKGGKAIALIGNWGSGKIYRSQADPEEGTRNSSSRWGEHSTRTTHLSVRCLGSRG